MFALWCSGSLGEMGSRSFLLAVSGVVLALGVFGVASASAVTFAGLAVPSSGDSVVLAGDSVVWSQGLVDRANVVRRVLPGGQVSEVFRTPALSRGRIVLPPALGASDRLLAIGSGEYEVAPDGFSDPIWSEIRVGPLGGQLAITVGRDRSPDKYGFDVSGDVLASIERQAAGASRCVVRVRDFGGTGNVTVGPPLACATSTTPAVRLAGSWAATLVPTDSGSKIAVYNWSTGRLAYKLAVSDRLTDVTWDLQDDGTVAVSGPSGVGWASVAEPRRHSITAPRLTSAARLASGQLTYLRRRASAKTKPHDPSLELVVQALDGQPRPVSFPLASAEAFDFDGSRAALLTDQCVYEGNVSSGPAPTAPPTGICPGVAISLTPRLAYYPEPGLSWNPATQTLTTRIFCELSGPNGCTGALTVTGTHRRTGRPLRVATGSFAAPRFGVSHARLHLAPAKLADLRRASRRGVRVTVTATAWDASDRQVTTRRSLAVRVR